MAASAQASAEELPSSPVATGVSYERIDRWGVDRLNEILTHGAPAFTGLEVDYTPATHAVDLYRVTYPTVVPLWDNQPVTVTGLLAIPDNGAGTLPLLSYQHGSIYRRDEVPSHPDKSPQTQLILAQFAGQGYAVAAADYLGLGGSDSPQSYLVKSSHQQTTTDLLGPVAAILAAQDWAMGPLFLAGWSQGGYTTMAMLERLERQGTPVTAAATAAAPLDLYLSISGYLHYPRKIDADWLNTLLVMNVFALQEYHQLPGFAASVLTPAGYENGRKLYHSDPSFRSEDLPVDLRALIREEYFNPPTFSRSRWGRILNESSVYRWVIQTPVRNDYGGSDEAITVGVGRMAQTWQQAMGAGNQRVQAISMGSDATHRGTFARAVAEWKVWFDSMR